MLKCNGLLEDAFSYVFFSICSGCPSGFIRLLVRGVALLLNWIAYASSFMGVSQVYFFVIDGSRKNVGNFGVDWKPVSFSRKIFSEMKLKLSFAYVPNFFVIFSFFGHLKSEHEVTKSHLVWRFLSSFYLLVFWVYRWVSACREYFNFSPVWEGSSLCVVNFSVPPASANGSTKIEIEPITRHSPTTGIFCALRLFFVKDAA